MTGEDWLGCADIRQMLTSLDRPPNDRKMLSFAVACCHAIWPRLPRPEGLPGLEYAESWSLEGIRWTEQYAEGATDPNIDYGRLYYTLEAAVLHWQQVPHCEDLEREKSLRGRIESIDEWTDHDLRQTRGQVNRPTHFLTDHELENICKQWASAADLAYCLPSIVHISRRGAISWVNEDALRYIDDNLLSPDLLRDIFGNPFRPVTFAPAWRTTDAIGVARSMYDARDFAAMPILADALEDAGCDSADVLAHCRGDGPHVRGCWAVDLVLGKN